MYPNTPSWGEAFPNPASYLYNLPLDQSLPLSPLPPPQAIRQADVRSFFFLQAMKWGVGGGTLERENPFFLSLCLPPTIAKL